MTHHKSIGFHNLIFTRYIGLQQVVIKEYFLCLRLRLRRRLYVCLGFLGLWFVFLIRLVFYCFCFILLLVIASYSGCRRLLVLFLEKAFDGIVCLGILWDGCL